jgi:hypothetical protein
MAFVRRIFVLASAAGGVWGAIEGLRMLARQVGSRDEFTISGEGALLVIPVALVGAALGALLGGLVFPQSRN